MNWEPWRTAGSSSRWNSCRGGPLPDHGCAARGTRRAGLGRCGGLLLPAAVDALYQATQAVAYAHAVGCSTGTSSPTTSCSAVSVRSACSTGASAHRGGHRGPGRRRRRHGAATRTGRTLALSPVRRRTWRRAGLVGPPNSARRGCLRTGSDPLPVDPGRPPHGRALEARSALVGFPLQLLPDPALVDLVEARLAAQPSDRPANAGALAAMLGDWPDGARRRARPGTGAAGRRRLLVGVTPERAAEVRAEAARVRGEIDAVYEAGNKAGDFAPWRPAAPVRRGRPRTASRRWHGRRVRRTSR